MKHDKIINSVEEVSFHRNGVGGNGFYAVLFTADLKTVSEKEAAVWALTAGEGKKDAKWLAIVFDEPGSCAVICLDLLPARGVKFGGNSWRGDLYEPELREAIVTMQSSGSIRVGPFGIATE